jgi:3D (Asp-Asp-Asp) domain-containing protein
VILRNKSALALAAGMVLVAGLGVGYASTRSSAECDSGQTGCDKVGTVSSTLAAGPNACNGVALTFSAEAGTPAVTSNVFPIGTQLKITNLDNGKATTVPVTGVSGSCALLNVAAMDQVRETGKNVIRRNTVEVVKAVATAPTTGAGAAAPASSGACNGVNLTFSAEAGAPAVTSNVFPIGTKLKITNLDNSKTTTVPVTGVSGSCALLNVAAMDQIRETGKNVIRRNTVEVVGGGTAVATTAPAAAAPVSSGACNGVNLTFSAEAGAPAVTSNVFPIGTKLKITNLDNSKTTTVPVTGVSGSCALLNVAAMDQIREAGKNVIRHNTVVRLK